MDDSDLVPISALQHYAFCERQCALIHVERLWADNDLTVEGTQLHLRVDSGGLTRSTQATIWRSVPVRSSALGLIGVVDSVEVEERNGVQHYFPVEYKRGKRVERDADDIQLCAQATALEEMLDVAIPDGAVVYLASQRRRHVMFTSELRARTATAAQAVHELLRDGGTPVVKPAPRCRRCSLRELCMVEVVSRPEAARRYVSGLFEQG